VSNLSDIPGLDVGEEVEEPEGPSGPKPEGEYHCEITDVEIDAEKSYGKRLEVEYTILAPEPYDDGKMWHGLNIQHTSEEAQQIAIDEFKSICWASGLDTIPDDTDKLLGKELFVTMGHTEYTHEGDQRVGEEVKYVNPVSGQPSGPRDEQPDHGGGSTDTDDDLDEEIPF